MIANTLPAAKKVYGVYCKMSSFLVYNKMYLIIQWLVILRASTIAHIVFHWYFTEHMIY